MMELRELDNNLCGVCVQVETLRRQDNSERLRQAESQLSELQAELEVARERETQAREREGQARQAASLSEERAKQQQLELAEVGRMCSISLLPLSISPPPPPPSLSPSLSFFRDSQQPSLRAMEQAIEKASRPHPLAPPLHQVELARMRWGTG